jgi:hypothetical protein
MVWTTEQGWACSQCGWRCALPPLLSDEEAKNAFDRLASAKFRDHHCSDFAAQLGSESSQEFSTRVRKHINHGYKPKDAVEIVLQEVMLECRGDAKAIEQARADAGDFLRRLKQEIS